MSSRHAFLFCQFVYFLFVTMGFHSARQSVIALFFLFFGLLFVLIFGAEGILFCVWLRVFTGLIKLNSETGGFLLTLCIAVNAACENEE